MNNAHASLGNPVSKNQRCCVLCGSEGLLGKRGLFGWISRQQRAAAAAAFITRWVYSGLFLLDVFNIHSMHVNVIFSAWLWLVV